MWFARQEAPDPARSALRSLRPSLNTPVVVVEDLPSGPASAAIASVTDPAGPRVLIAVRSERSGEAIFFGPDEDLREWQGAEVAVEAALSFAESMGFLFEDDRMALAPGEAHRLWRELVEACASAGSAAPRSPAPAVEPSAPPPLALAPSTPPRRTRADGDTVAPAPVPRALGRSLPLTKFRRAPADVPRRSTERAGVPAEPQRLGRFRVGLDRRSG